MNKPSWSLRGQSTMLLDAATSAGWQDSGPDGYALRKELRRDAALLAAQLGRAIEISSADGIVLEQVEVQS